jgi:hypothetical protein
LVTGGGGDAGVGVWGVALRIGLIGLVEMNSWLQRQGRF